MLGKMKKMGVLLLMGLLLCGSAGAEEGICIVQTRQGVLLSDAYGEALTEVGEYNVLYELTGLPQGMKRFVAEKTTEKMIGYALLNEKGEALTEFEYQAFEFVDNALIFTRKNYCGVMDLDGNVLIEALYTVLIPTGDGGYLAQKTSLYDELPDTVYRIAANGTEQVSKTRITGGMYPMSEALCPAVSADNARYGYLNVAGGWAIAPQFEWADSFEGGRAIVASAEGTGMIDTQGKWVLAPQYDSVSRRGDSLIVATIGNTMHLIHPQTLQTVASYSGNNLYGTPTEGMMAIVMDGIQGKIVNEQGQSMLTVEPCMSISRWTGMDERVIVTSGEFGTASVRLYDLAGKPVSNAYQEIVPLGKINGEMYYVFISFEAARTEYSKGISFWDEIPDTRECGVLSPDGKELFRVKAEYITWLGNERILIERAEESDFADIFGNVLKTYKAGDSQ